MYSCTFIKCLWKEKQKKRKFKTLEKKITLPFPPTIGMEVGDGDWFSGKIERIIWDNKENNFTIKVQDIIPKEGITAELLLDVAIKQGWDTQD